MLCTHTLPRPIWVSISSRLVPYRTSPPSWVVTIQRSVPVVRANSSGVTVRYDGSASGLLGRVVMVDTRWTTSECRWSNEFSRVSLPTPYGPLKLKIAGILAMIAGLRGWGGGLGRILRRPDDGAAQAS